MARVTVVERAQVRYETKPVIDEETGQQKRVPVMKRVWDELKEEYVQKQKTTKKGKPVFMRVTEADKSRPKPNRRCDYPGCDIDGGEIKPGTAYKWIKPKSGPYGGSLKCRHKAHPSWQVWEYSSSLSANLARVSHDFWSEIDGVESVDDVQSALDSAAEAIKEIAEEKRESASNVESGFGVRTSMVDELEETADSLENWADEVAQADIPEPEDCTECDGEGTVECETCEGEGEVDGETCVECAGEKTVECQAGCVEGADIDGWKDQLQDALSIIDESPV